MKHTAISIIILFFFVASLSFSSALTFQLNSPQNATLNVSFSVSLSAETTDIYDVKIFIYKDSRTFSEIFNGSSWLNSYKYLLSKFPQTKDFQVVSHFAGDTTICARLRKSGASSSSGDACNPIKIIAQSIENSTPPENKSEVQVEQEENITKPSPKIEADFIPEKSQVAQVSSASQEPEKIILNSAPKSSGLFVSQQEKIRLYAVYAFAALATIIIILFALKKL